MATQVKIDYALTRALSSAEYRLSMGYPLTRVELNLLLGAYAKLVEITSSFPTCSCIRPWAEERFAVLSAYEPRD